MAKIDVNQSADIRAVLGAPGTGKSHYTKAEIAKARRVVVWDLEDEYSDLVDVQLSELAAQLHTYKNLKVRFIPSSDKKIRARQFDLFCKIILESGNVLLVVEELRFVTSPSHSPSGWAGITLRGRKRGVKVIGTSQRPAQIDKDFLGSCTFIRTGALNYPADRKAVADVIGIPVEDIAGLTGYQAITWQRSPRKVTKSS